MHACTYKVHAHSRRLLHSRIQSVCMVCANHCHAYDVCMVFFCCALSGCIALLDCKCQTVTSVKLSRADGWNQTVLSCPELTCSVFLHWKHIAWADCSFWVSGILPYPSQPVQELLVFSFTESATAKAIIKRAGQLCSCGANFGTLTKQASQDQQRRKNLCKAEHLVAHLWTTDATLSDPFSHSAIPLFNTEQPASTIYRSMMHGSCGAGVALVSTIPGTADRRGAARDDPAH